MERMGLLTWSGKGARESGHWFEKGTLTHFWEIVWDFVQKKYI